MPLFRCQHFRNALYNANGQLGNGTTTARWVAGQVSGLSSITGIAAGRQHSVAIRSDGATFTWGDNTYGQLGDGTTTRRTSPVQVPGVTNVLSAAAGNHTITMNSQGEIQSWGYNANGQLGNGNNSNRTLPGQVVMLTFGDRVATPTLTPAGGMFLAAPSVMVTCSDPGAVIHYTANGSDPTESDPVVASGSSLLPVNGILRVRGFQTGRLPSETRSACYRALRKCWHLNRGIAGILHLKEGLNQPALLLDRAHDV